MHSDNEVGARRHSGSEVALLPAAEGAAPQTGGDLGPEWMARLQDFQELRDERRAGSRQILEHVEDVLPLVLDIKVADKLHLLERFESRINESLQCLARKAYEMVRNEFEELQSLRHWSAEAEEKLARMNGSYLREISMNRDKSRPCMDALKAAIAAVDQANAVEFYEPLQYLSQEARSTTITIIEEKLKAIFAYDPSLQEQTNPHELARFEESILRERLSSCERLNSNLRTEVRDMRARLKKSEALTDKQHWEYDSSRRKIRKLEDELETLRTEHTDALEAAKDLEHRLEAQAAAHQAEKAAATQAAAAQAAQAARRAARQPVQAAAHPATAQAVAAQAAAAAEAPAAAQAPTAAQAAAAAPRAAAAEAGGELQEVSRPPDSAKAEDGPAKHSSGPVIRSDAAVQTEAGPRRLRISKPKGAQEQEPMAVGDANGGLVLSGDSDLMEQLQKAQRALTMTRAVLKKREAQIAELRSEGVAPGQNEETPVCRALTIPLDASTRLETEEPLDPKGDAARHTQELKSLQRDLQAARESAEAMQAEASRWREEASRWREEASRWREEASRGQEEASRWREEASRGREEASRGREEGSRGREEASRGREEETEPSAPDPRAAPEGAEAVRAEAPRWREEASRWQEEATVLQAEVARLQTEVQAREELRQRLRQELERAHEEAESAERRRLQALREQAQGSCGTAGIAAELDSAIRACSDLKDELEQSQAALSLVLSRNAALEALVSGAGDEPLEWAGGSPQSSPSAQATRMRATDRDKTLCQEQRDELRRRMVAQKAQLQDVVQENQVLHLALEEMQHEVRSLIRQLRRHMPEAQVISGDLESVIGKMEKVARHGGGAYVRLHREARLRQVGKEVHADTEAPSATAGAAEPSPGVDTAAAVAGPISPTEAAAAAAGPVSPTSRQPRTSGSKAAPIRVLQTPSKTTAGSTPQPAESVWTLPAPVSPGRSTIYRHSIDTGSLEAKMLTVKQVRTINALPLVTKNPREAVRKQHTAVTAAGVTPMPNPVGQETRLGSLALGARGGMAILSSRFPRASA